MKQCSRPLSCNIKKCRLLQQNQWQHQEMSNKCLYTPTWPPLLAVQWTGRSTSQLGPGRAEWKHKRWKRALLLPSFATRPHWAGILVFQSLSDMSGHSGALLGPCLGSFIALFCSLYPSQPSTPQEISLVQFKRATAKQQPFSYSLCTGALEHESVHIWGTF